MEVIDKFKTPEKNLVRTTSLPLYSTLLLSNQKSKYKRKISRINSIQKINESSETSGLTRINSINRSNTQLISEKSKRKVSFAPSYRLVSYVDFNPNKPIFKTNDKNEENNGKNNETNTVCLHCTCILL